MLETERLVLRRWEDGDASDLYEYAKDPDVGPIAGWPPHQSIEESREVIKNAFTGREAYAVCLKTDGKAIGAIELKLNGYTDMTDRDDNCLTSGVWKTEEWKTRKAQVSAFQVLSFGNPEADTLLIQMVDDHDLEVIENEVSYIEKLSGGQCFDLKAIRVKNWNDDLSPWPAPAVFGNEEFGGGAKETLEFVLGKIVPTPEEIKSRGIKRVFIGGYSLAALFALWAGYQTNAFDGIASASPSVWFPQFTDFMQENEIHTEAVYLSLGDREERTRNPVMSKVGAAIREANNLLATSGVDCELEWNKGNHFKDPDFRTAKAFAWLMNR